MDFAESIGVVEVLLNFGACRRPQSDLETAALVTVREFSEPRSETTWNSGNGRRGDCDSERGFGKRTESIRMM